jgi:hypothetical protein
MNSYANAGIAHAELLLVTCFEKENRLGNKNLLPSVGLQGLQHQDQTFIFAPCTAAIIALELR